MLGVLKREIRGEFRHLDWDFVASNDVLEESVGNSHCNSKYNVNQNRLPFLYLYMMRLFDWTMHSL